ncbi:hypothetical protein [Bosea vaviloviae]|uniref:MalT-like TPR region domain-containing protein n=1 Tax=Bosea vaviloviae TaxID=1526658 RepID=A0A1D7TXR1_9HYPH|nr:hypothetical protein [Bosea vaviloviae]AOO79911.1 hypothetical protein BHK69_04920 [Bosea vaviloviae]
MVVLPAMVADWLRRPGSAPPGEALLERRAVDFLALAGRLGAPLGDKETRRLRSEAASALADGRFADADKALAQAELHSIGGASDLSTLPVAQRLRIGENRADRAGISFLRTTPEAYREAAGRYGEASALIGLADVDRSRAVALAQAKALARLSEDFGGRDGYDAAVTVLHRLLEGLDSLEDTVAFAGAQDALAATLEALAEIAGMEDLRVEALARCRAGVEHLHRDEAPLLWHALTVRFGRLAVTIGESREDDALLEEAVTALATVLAVWDRNRDEARWLEAEHMISRARAALGGRRNDLALLERAFNGFNRVAKAVDRAREPLRWAELQDQMGGVLVAMGERYRDPVVFEEAIAVFAAALEERRRESVPLLWATSSANQALPMMRLAERRKDAALARQALTQIAVAIEAMRSAGFAANAKHLEARLIKAGALVEALNKA